LDELIAGHPKHFYNSMGMNKHVFAKLLEELIQVGLHDTRYVTAEEQLAIFLYLAVTGLAQRHLKNAFSKVQTQFPSQSCFVYNSEYVIDVFQSCSSHS